MGVYIPSIKMPKSCPKCRNSGLKLAIDELGLKCPERKEIWGPTAADIKGIRRADCPLIFVQAHGRLGDLDVLLAEINKICDRRDAGIISDLTCLQQLLSAVRHAPTIIEAEEE